MTTATEPITCPAWCDNGREPCNGEHAGDGATVPASAGWLLQHLVDRDWTGAHIPLVTVGPRWNQTKHDADDAPSVCLFVDDGGHRSAEVEVWLRAHEVRRLISALEDALSALEGRSK